MSIHRLITNHF